MIRINNGYVSVETDPYSTSGTNFPALIKAMADEGYSVPLKEGGRAYFNVDGFGTPLSKYFVTFPPHHFKPEELADEKGLYDLAQSIISEEMDKFIALRARMRILDQAYGSAATK